MAQLGVFFSSDCPEAIQLSHDSASGSGEIHYQMLMHLTNDSQETFLNIFNNI